MPNNFLYFFQQFQFNSQSKSSWTNEPLGAIYFYRKSSKVSWRFCVYFLSNENANSFLVWSDDTNRFKRLLLQQQQQQQQQLEIGKQDDFKSFFSNFNIAMMVIPKRNLFISIQANQTWSRYYPKTEWFKSAETRKIS